MALIADETILAVKQAADVVEVVQGYIPLKRAGASYKALCPFHEEKSPSFTVNPERQTFKCFGCGKGGDAIGFVMDYEKLDYPDAIKVLADKIGIPIKYKEGSHDGLSREDLYKVNAWAQGIYRKLLLDAPEGQVARDFLERRGILPETSELYGLGYSMDSWDYLLQRGHRAGYSDKLLTMAGLLVQKDSGGFYDRFRGRLMFPIYDFRGKAIAFGARTLKDEAPKFLNTPETAIFTKGKTFYGLHLGRETIDEAKAAYIVEGYMDVIVPFQAGIKQMIAPMGTALTQEHVKLLRRYADKIILMFDADAAGERASDKSLTILLSENVDIFVAQLPAGMDPDDVILKQGADALKACLEKPREIFDFMIDMLIAKHGFETAAAKARVVEDMIERMALLPDPFKQELFIKQLANRLDMPEAPIRGKLFRKLDPKAEERPVPQKADDPKEQRAKLVLACAFSSPDFAKRVRAEYPVDDYPTPMLRAIAAKTYELFDRDGEIRGKEVMDAATRVESKQAIAELVDMELPKEEADVQGAHALAAVLSENARVENDALTKSLQTSESDSVEEGLRQSMENKRKNPKDHGRMNLEE